MLDIAPEKLDELIIKRPAPAVNADAKGRILLECSDKRITGELRALVTVEDFRDSLIPEGFPEEV
jgi:hypothetical protein